MSKASLIKVIEGRIKFWEDKVKIQVQSESMRNYASGKVRAFKTVLNDIERELPDE